RPGAVPTGRSHPHVDARCRGRQRLPPGRLLGARSEVERDRRARLSALIPLSSGRRREENRRVQRVAAGFLVAVALAAAGAAPIAGQDRGLTPLAGLSVTNGGAPFAGDRPWLTTITPDGDGPRDSAEVHFPLRAAARVRLAISRTRLRPETVYAHTYRLGPGPHTLTWTPSPEREARTYLVRLFVKGVNGATANYGRAVAHRARDAPVIRLLGIDAG